MQDKLHTRRIAAEIIGDSLRKFDERVSRKEIVPTRIGGRIRFSQRELDRFKAARARGVYLSAQRRAEQLKLVRESAGLTPNELETLCQLEPGTVAAAEQGRPMPQEIFARLMGNAIYAVLANQPEEMTA
jgi:hypothetical protein